MLKIETQTVKSVLFEGQQYFTAAQKSVLILQDCLF
jgi:hypothetical protein